LNAVNDHKELGNESLNDESILRSEGNGLLLDASKEGQGAETVSNQTREVLIPLFNFSLYPAYCW
jgi:hypothetical protein